MDILEGGIVELMTQIDTMNLGTDGGGKRLYFDIGPGHGLEVRGNLSVLPIVGLKRTSPQE